MCQGGFWEWVGVGGMSGGADWLEWIPAYAGMTVGGDWLGVGGGSVMGRYGGRVLVGAERRYDAGESVGWF